MLDNDIENKNYKAVMVWGIDDEDSVAFIKPLTEWYGKAVIRRFRYRWLPKAGAV